MHIPEREPKKHFSYHQKMAIIQEHLDKGLSLSFLARKYRLSAGSLYHWKRHYVMGEPEKPLAGLTIDDVMDEKKKLEKENEYLKKAIGQLTLEKEILHDANKILKKKYEEYLQSKSEKKSYE